MAKTKSNGYAITRKALPEDVGGQKRAVYDAIAKGARDAAAVREAVRGSAAFKGAKDETVKNNVAWHIARLRRDGLLR